MRSCLLLLAVLVACEKTPPKPPSAEPAVVEAPVWTPPKVTIRPAELEGWADTELGPYVASGVVGVVLGGKLVWQRGVGVSGRGLGPDSKTIYRFGSLTKVLTGIALARLVEEGQLAWDDPVAKYVPERAKQLAGVTVRHLVTHTSGIPSLGDETADYTEKPPSEKAFLAALDAPLEFPPGSEMRYSNFGAALGGLVAARAAGTSYRELMAGRVLGPLGMTTASWDEPAQHAAGQDHEGKLNPPSWRFGAAEACGGLWGSLEDLAGLALFALGHQQGVLGEAARLATMKDDPLPGDVGVAWQIGKGGVWHNGSTLDFSASMVVRGKEDLAVIVLVAGSAGPLADCLAENLATALARNRRVETCAPLAPASATAMFTAFERLLALLAAPDTTDVTTVFEGEFLAAHPRDEVVAWAKKKQAELGRCKPPEPSPLATLRSVVELECEHGIAQVLYEIDRFAPHRFKLISLNKK